MHHPVFVLTSNACLEWNVPVNIQCLNNNESLKNFKIKSEWILYSRREWLPCQLAIVWAFFGRFADVTSKTVPRQKSLAKEWRSNDLLQIIGCQLVIHPSSTAPAGFQLAFEFVDNFQDLALSRKQNKWFVLESIGTSRQHNCDAHFVVPGGQDWHLNGQIEAIRITKSTSFTPFSATVKPFDASMKTPVSSAAKMNW